jgi:hypothetical protein
MLSKRTHYSSSANSARPDLMPKRPRSHDLLSPLPPWAPSDYYHL